jgi:hypothetical protein
VRLRQQRIQHHRLVPGRQQRVHHMRTDEPGATRHEYPHTRTLRGARRDDPQPGRHVSGSKEMRKHVGPGRLVRQPTRPGPATLNRMPSAVGARLDLASRYPMATQLMAKEVRPRAYPYRCRARRG